MNRRRNEPKHEASAANPQLVVGIGTSSVDHLCLVTRHPRLDSKQQLLHYEVQPGGQVPTALVALQRWGLRTAYVGVFADDPGGHLARGSLAREGVDLTAAELRPNTTQPVSVILIDHVTGERSVLYQPGSRLSLNGLNAAALECLRHASAVLLDAVDLPLAVAAAREGKTSGALIVLDVDRPAPGIEELLALSDIVITSPEFPMRLAATENLARALRFTASLGPWFTAATLGPGGALAYVRGQEHFVRGYPVHAVDSTGAGDVFHAGCIYGVLLGWPPEQTLRFAAAASALKCRAIGGRPGIPTASEALELSQDRRG
ncbi:Sulfofructose kinase [bacterium HR30]|nr:Sulfofructose kinase [bacterium HR30]